MSKLSKLIGNLSTEAFLGPDPWNVSDPRAVDPAKIDYKVKLILNGMDKIVTEYGRGLFDQPLLIKLIGRFKKTFTRIIKKIIFPVDHRSAMMRIKMETQEVAPEDLEEDNQMDCEDGGGGGGGGDDGGDGGGGFGGGGGCDRGGGGGTDEHQATMVEGQDFDEFDYSGNSEPLQSPPPMTLQASEIWYRGSDISDELPVPVPVHTQLEVPPPPPLYPIFQDAAIPSQFLIRRMNHEATMSAILELDPDHPAANWNHF